MQPREREEIHPNRKPVLRQQRQAPDSRIIFSRFNGRFTFARIDISFARILFYEYAENIAVFTPFTGNLDI